MKEDVVKVDRLPPHSTEAEQGVLGCVLTDWEGTYNLCVERLARWGNDVFYDLRHATIWAAVREIAENKRAVDLIVLHEELKRRHELENIGGLAYLNSLVDAGVIPSNIEHYLDILEEKATARLQIRICTQTVGAFYESDKSAREIIADHEARIHELGESRTVGFEETAKEGTLRVIDNLDEYQRGKPVHSGLMLGFEYWDKMTTGIHKEELWVLAGRPGTGKTSLAMNGVEYLAVDKGIPVGVFSIEMSSGQLWDRLVWQRARSDFQRYRTGFMEKRDLDRICAVIPEIGKSPIVIDTTPGISVSVIRSKLRRWIRDYGIQMAVIDYFQLIQPDQRVRGFNRDQELAEVSRQLKSTAKELGIGIVVLAALNRDFEKSGGTRKPQMSDIRECGGLEYDADAIHILYQPALRKEKVFHNNTESEETLYGAGSDWSKFQRRVNLMVCKQRHGPTGDAELVFLKNCMRFQDFKRPT